MEVNKKKYTIPAIEVMEAMEEEGLLAGSVTSEDTGLDFGGTDKDGVLDPLSRILNIDPLNTIETKLPPDLQ